ncbi:hypothetical protein COV18_06525 [Candidatus Woesearchaeota archaeon CG10_big_fil_rev_8_21_14_0_10_37_12]|nr:MAG: hypothetical protein COV18_06525 [Candidatus Woesearchaeota archaeon CG10_big_fil_rev_8_21_14_0_10_37_12]
MEREIEIKFGIPTSAYEEILKKVAQIARDGGYDVVEPRFESREIQYYDCHIVGGYGDYAINKAGATVRRVGRFDSNNHPAIFRYDFKKGVWDDRVEQSKWSNKELIPEEICELLELGDSYRNLFPSAFAYTKHEKQKMRKGMTIIEASVDAVSVVTRREFVKGFSPKLGPPIGVSGPYVDSETGRYLGFLIEQRDYKFNELELELEEGEVADLKGLANMVKEELQLPREYLQKYSKIRFWFHCRAYRRRT